MRPTQVSTALQLEQEAQKTTMQLQFWCDSCLAMADYIYEESVTKVGASSADDAFKALQTADEIFSSV